MSPRKDSQPYGSLEQLREKSIWAF